MVDRTVTARFQADVAGAIANITRLGKAIGDSAKAGTEFAAKNKESFDTVATSAAGIGITSGVALGAAVKSFADFDKAMSQVRAATGETAGNMELLRTAALAAGKDTSFSAKEAAEGIESLAKAGVSTKDILGGGLTGALDLAAAGQIGVAEAADVAATAMTQFKLAGTEVPHIADLLAAAAGKAQGDVGDMAAALKQGGLVASQFGLSVEETTGTLAAFASAGLLGSDAGTSFKTMLIALANPSKEAAQTMKDLGVNAYDAQGAFIGVAPLADQLKTKLSGLTQEQRNAALATIFGTDAIRAASILYDQGAQGIADWTTKVNDSGFAAEQARVKTDNLSGDVERLGGALDTALIQGGSGANTVLRGLVQAADGAVSAFAELPPAVTGTAAALAAVGTVGGLGAAGMLKAVSAAGELREAWTSLGRVGKTLTLSAGAIGIALVAAGALYSAFTSENEKAKASVDNFRGTLDQTTGAITGNTRAYVANELAQSGLAQSAKGFGLSLSTVTDAALGNKSAMDGLVSQLNAVINANVIAGSGAKSGVEQYNAQGEAAKNLRDKLLGMNANLTEAQRTQVLAAEGAKTNASAQDIAAAAHKKAADAAANQKQALSDLIAEMLRMPGQVLSLRDAQRGFQEAIDGASDALKENGRTLDINTPKGRANQQALDGIAKSANDVTKTLKENGASQQALGGHLKTAEGSIYRAARAFGYSDAQARAYTKSVLAVPPKADTKVTNNAAGKPKSDVATYKAMIGDIPSKKPTNYVAVGAGAATSAAQGLAGAIRGIPSSKTITIYQKMIGDVTSAGTKGVLRAGGGEIPGFSPGPRADNIPVMATAGEFMHQVDAVNYYGVSTMHALNNKRIPKAALQGYAYGGLVGSYATGGQVGGLDLSLILSQLFAAPGNPLAGLDFGKLLSAAKTAADSQRRARADLTKQQRERNAAVANQNRLDAQLKAQTSNIATLRAKGADQKVIKREQLEQIALQKQLNAAKAKTKKENADVTASEKRYQTAVDASKSTSEAYKDAMDKLNQTREAAVNLARQVADTQLQGTDIGSLAGQGAAGLLQGKQTKAKDLASYATTLERLQAGGLNKELLDQLRAGGLGNATIANQILSAGSGYIRNLNAAEGQVQAQAARIGAGAAAQAYNVTYLTNRIEIGGEVVRTVQSVIRSQQAQQKRAVTRR